MSNLRAASRYAKAVMDTALELKQVEQVEQDMRLIRATLAEHRELRAVLNSPVIKGSDKKGILDGLFKDASKTTKQLFALLETNKRMGLLDAVAERYLHLYEALKGQEVATVLTAVPLTSELEKKIHNQLKAITGKEVTLHNEVDASLVGGFVLRVGDLEYNASLDSKLAQLKRELVQK